MFILGGYEMKKIATLFLTLSVVCCLLFALPLNASAASTGAVEGLEVSLQTNKDTYAENEEIVVTLSIKNTNTFEVSGVSIDTLIPEGLNVKSGELDFTNITIPAGETYTTTVKTEMKPEETKPEETKPGDTQSPQTGDNSNITLWIVLLAISGTALVVLAFKNKKNATRVLSLFLCVAMIGVALPLGALATESNTASITVDKTITVGGKEFTIKSTITVDKQSDVADDEQKVPDEIAELFGIDPNETDSDNDGLSNYVEIYITGTSPTLVDTDGNGVNDIDEDADGDGLTNAEELVSNTALNDTDTDNDGLSDYKELKETNTNPLVGDTDSDGLSDGDEVTLGLNPLVQKTDGNTLDSEREFTQTLSENNIDEQLVDENNDAIPSLTLNTTGNINSRVRVEATESNDFSDSRAIVGEPIDIIGENLGQGTINFKLKSDSATTYSLQDELNTNLICRYNSDGSTEYLDTTFDTANNTVSAEITSEGTYFVLDVKNLFDELGLTFPQVSRSRAMMRTAAKSSGVMAQADIVFLIDTTGSMRDEINNVKNNVEYFVDALKAKGVSAGLALINYEDITHDGYDSTEVHKNGTSNWFYDIETYKSAIGALQLGDGGDTPESAVDALETARLLDMRASAGKIFILVTDADYKVDNRYGIPSMAAEIELLKNAGVTCAVVSPSSEKSTYYDLYNETNGVWANIYGDFYTELMELADKIGTDIVGDGYWIYLDGPVPVPVRLDEEPKAGSTVDTDKDGIADIDELEGTTPTGKINLDELLTKVSKGAITDTNYGTVMMYKYKSSPVETDTDFDGTDDLKDDMPKSNIFKGTTNRLKDNDIAAKGKVSFTVDYRYFFENNNIYQKNISVLSSLLAADIYEGKNGVYIEVTEGANLVGNHSPEEFVKLIGMQNVSSKPIGFQDNDRTDIVLGNKTITYNGQKKNIVLVSIRGTNGTFEEWSSNFDVGADTYQYYSLTGSTHFEWVNKENHKGFDVTANRIKSEVDKYIATTTDSSASTVLWITGHSRGAGIANILGAMYESSENFDTYTYTFAAPNTTTNNDSKASKYNSIFNIVNEDDMIPQLPLEAWGFTKYGINKTLSVEDFGYEDKNAFTNKEGTFEHLLGMDYNNNSKISDTLSAFKNVANNRNDLYNFTYSDDTLQIYGINHFNKSKAEKELNDIQGNVNSTMKQFCKFQVIEGTNIFGQTVYRAGNWQTPAYFMQVLALIAAKSGDGMGSAVATLTQNSVANKYENARNKFVLIGNDVTGGMNHPHWTETYYLIATNDFKKLK